MMQINKSRLKEIILEELKREMMSDAESTLEIAKAEQAIKELKFALEKLKMSLAGEWTIANVRGYSSSGEPDMSEIEQEIKNIESAIEGLEIAIQSERHSMMQRK